MREQIQWKLTDALAQAVKEEGEARIAQLFASILTNQPVLERMMDGYWYTRKGKVERLQVDEKSLQFITAAQGKFLVRYSVSFFFACDGITTDAAETMWCAFTVDLNSGIIVVQGEELLERSSDEF